MSKPFSPSCERNKDAILEVLKEVIQPNHKLLFEMGSGTGQHAVYLAPNFTHLQWQPTELKKNLSGIRSWLEEAQINNIKDPIEYSVGKTSLADIKYNIIFTANTFHIISWGLVKQFIKEIGNHLQENALFLVYGPFNYDNQYTSQSNREFDVWLKSKYPDAGIKDYEKVDAEFLSLGCQLVKDHSMPANNRFLVYQKA